MVKGTEGFPRAWPPHRRPRPQASTKRPAWRRIRMEVDHSLTAVLDHRRGLSEAGLEAGAALRASTLGQEPG